MIASHQLRHEMGDNRWYTPPQFVTAAKLVMGSIELDPASDAEANHYIQADRFYTAAENGLLKSWNAKTIWLNAPGKIGKPKDRKETQEEKQARILKNRWLGQERWQNRLIVEYQAGAFQQAIMLIFNATSIETKRIQSLKGVYAYCEVEGRIQFIPPHGKYENTDKNSNTQPSAFVYFGANPTRFYEVFCEFGVITMVGGVYRKVSAIPQTIPMFSAGVRNE